jgi:hypothetical protein
MIPALGPISVEAKLIAAALAVLALIAGVLLVLRNERQIGASACEAKAAQADASRTQAAAEQLRANDHRAADAAGDFRAAQAAITARQPEVRHALHDDLRAPLACPAAASAAVGDVLVPAAALSRLRAAAAPAGADSAAAR